MSYGLDFSDCRFVTDHRGNKLRADIPYNMFSMLIEFRQAALRSQTEQTEKTVRPGLFKGSLGSVGESKGESPTSRESRNAFPSKRERLESLFTAPTAAAVTQQNALSDSPHPEKKVITSSSARRMFFPRVFRAPIPVEVAQAIAGGTYFIRAWREYRQFSRHDSADLTGLSVDTIAWHEQGYNVPGELTLKRFAEIYDCSLNQLTGDNHLSERVERKTKNKKSEYKAAPSDTDYPDSVLAHIIAGKSPIAAWRIFRRMTVKELAERYGTSAYNLERMEANDGMRDKTLAKFCAIFHCTPDQLRRPEGLVVEPHKVRQSISGAANESGKSKTPGMQA